MQHGPSVEELLHARLQAQPKYGSEISAAPSGFGAVIPQTPQMSALDLVGLLGLVPMMLSGKGGGVARGARRPLTPAQKTERATMNRELGARAAAGDLQAKQSLVERMQGLLYKLTEKYAPPTKMGAPDQRSKTLAPVKEPDISRGELQQVGSQAAMESLETYKPEKGDPAPHIKSRARGAMARFKQDQSRDVRIPEEEVHERIALRKVDSDLAKRHFQLTGTWREPDPLAAASVLSMRRGQTFTEKDIQRLRGNISEERLDRGSEALRQARDIPVAPEQEQGLARTDRARFNETAKRVIEKYPPEMQAFILDVTEGTKTDREIAKEHRISPSMVPRRYASTIRKLQAELGQVKQFSELGVKAPTSKEPPMAAITRALSQASGKSPAEVAQYLEVAGIQTPEQLNRFVNEVRPPNTRVLSIEPPEAQSRAQAAREYSAQELIPIGEVLKRFYPYTPKKLTEEAKRPGPLESERYRTGAYGPLGIERRPPRAPFTPETRTIEESRRAVEEFHREQGLGFKGIGGGSGIGEMSGIPISNFGPELKRLPLGMSGQPADWAQRQPPVQNLRAATASPGRDFFFGNPKEDFHPGVAEKQDIGLTANTYTRLRTLINAMAPYYKYGRQ